jgi:hypothetical protein
VAEETAVAVVVGSVNERSVIARTSAGFTSDKNLGSEIANCKYNAMNGSKPAQPTADRKQPQNVTGIHLHQLTTTGLSEVLVRTTVPSTTSPASIVRSPSTLASSSPSSTTASAPPLQMQVVARQVGKP